MTEAKKLFKITAYVLGGAALGFGLYKTASKLIEKYPKFNIDLSNLCSMTDDKLSVFKELDKYKQKIEKQKI
ncbi:MAG: hypothetical protein N3D10_01175 [Candidatus Micrarchaeota archaeon]|nr:hypothetical protein [Candidatus Micrarchaeota archaeon]